MIWRGAAAYFEPRERGFWETMQTYYPDAAYSVVKPPTGGDPMYYTGFVSRQQLADRQGLDATYVVNGSEVAGRRDTVTDSTWHPDAGPDEFPYQVMLTGSLHVPEYGEYKLLLDSPRAVVHLNGARVLDSNNATARLILAAGLHALSIVAEVESPTQSVRVLWLNENGDPEPIPFGRLYRGSVRPVGLAGRFFEGDRASGAPDSMQVTPSMDLFHYTPVVPYPYTVTWDGALQTDVPGPYRFKVGRTHNGRIRALRQRPPSSLGSFQRRHSRHRRDRPPDRPTQHARRVHRPLRPTQFELLWALGSSQFTPIPIELITPAPEHMMILAE